MTEHEDRLVRALTAEAERRDVDAHALLAATRERLVRTSRPARRLSPLVAAAAAVVLAASGAVALGVAGPGPRDDGGAAAERGDVEHSFSCPDRLPVDVSGAQDEFLPRLDGRGPAAVAKEYGAPRWDFVEEGERARLYLGNEDGTLGSVSSYSRDGDAWSLREATACGNGSPEAPTADGLRLGRHGGEPWPARDVLDAGGRDAAVSVLVDDRAVYDHSGLTLRHRSIYAAPCGPRLCVAIGQPDSGTRQEIRLRTDGAVTTFEVCGFFVPDDMVGRAAPYRLVGVWDPTGAGTAMEAASVQATTLADMQRRPALDTLGDTFAGAVREDPSWGGGRLWLSLLPAREGHGVIASLRDDRARLSFASPEQRC